MPPAKDDKSKDIEKETNDQWIAAQRKETEHRKWLWNRLRGTGAWIIATLWLVSDGWEKIQKLKIYIFK